MHYGGSKKECKKFQEPYMTLKPFGREIPENKELSDLDIKALKTYYAPPSELSFIWLESVIFTFKIMKICHLISYGSG